MLLIFFSRFLIRFLRALTLQGFETLSLCLDRLSAVAIGTDPTDVPFIETRHLAATVTRIFEVADLRDLVLRLFGDRFLIVGQISVVVIANGANRHTARAATKGAGDMYH